MYLVTYLRKEFDALVDELVDAAILTAIVRKPYRRRSCE